MTRKMLWGAVLAALFCLVVPAAADEQADKVLKELDGDVLLQEGDAYLEGGRTDDELLRAGLLDFLDGQLSQEPADAAARLLKGAGHFLQVAVPARIPPLSRLIGLFLLSFSVT